MEIKRLFRFVSVVLLAVMLVTSLSACRLAASEGPEEAAGDDYPVPSEEAQPSSFDNAATATVQANQGGSSGGGSNQPAVVTETPVPATATAVPPEYVQATPGIPTEYTLKYGEFPFCIARRFNVDQYELLAINGLGLNSATYVGMTLKIPQTGNHFDGAVALKAHPGDYKVKAGETLEIIACKFGNVSPDMIALQNGLEAPYTLTAGQILIIP